jgi:hypothetical protein
MRHSPPELAWAAAAIIATGIALSPLDGGAQQNDPDPGTEACTAALTRAARVCSERGQTSRQCARARSQISTSCQWDFELPTSGAPAFAEPGISPGPPSQAICPRNDLFVEFSPGRLGAETLGSLDAAINQVATCGKTRRIFVQATTNGDPLDPTALQRSAVVREGLIAGGVAAEDIYVLPSNATPLLANTPMSVMVTVESAQSVN